MPEFLPQPGDRINPNRPCRFPFDQARNRFDQEQDRHTLPTEPLDKTGSNSLDLYADALISAQRASFYCPGEATRKGIVLQLLSAAEPTATIRHVVLLTMGLTHREAANEQVVTGWKGRLDVV